MTTEGHAKQPYMMVWGVLFLLTILEVLFAFTGLSKMLIAIGLIIMAVWKALLVALYYMHLRHEPHRMWVMVAAPLPLVAIMLVAVISEF